MGSESLSAKAQMRWKKVIQRGDLVIDATIGNGHDSLFILQLLQNEGQLVGYDIQKSAIDKTRERLSEYSNFVLKQKSHAEIEERGARLICYNLGYLPGSDKSVTTMTATTLQSLKSAKRALMPGGLLSILCYPGHAEGEKESEAVLDWAKRQNGQLKLIFSPSPFLILLEPAP